MPLKNVHLDGDISFNTPFLREAGDSQEELNSKRTLYQKCESIPEALGNAVRVELFPNMS